MRKFIFMALSFAFISSILFGCQLKENRPTAETQSNSSVKSEHNKKLAINKDFTKISVSKSKGMGEIVIDDNESLKAFQNIFSSAVKEEGIVNMANPEFYLDVIYDKKNRKRLYLWIGENGQSSTLMKTENTNTVYTVSGETTNKLIELIAPHFN